jgi:hypothetical protein
LALMNYNTNQVTPTGSLTYTQTGGQYDYNGNWIPQTTATQTLSPELQGLYNQTTGIAGTAGSCRPIRINCAAMLTTR